MKIKQEHYQVIFDAFSALNREQVAAHKALNLGINKERRFIFDLLYMANLSAFISIALYEYLSDDNIFAAAKHAAKQLNF